MKKQLTKIILAVALGLAFAFTLSCGEHSQEEILFYSSSSETQSSSSSKPGSSTGGSAFGTAVIGIQTWMSKNLDSEAEGSKCYNNDPANCTKYGRLYDWATAMVLPSKCNDVFYTADADCDIAIPNHQGLCPAGWHIPSEEDWEVLTKFIDPRCSGSSGGCDSVAIKLKARSDWGASHNGTDKYKFAALPGGSRLPNGKFRNGGAGGSGYWWGASDKDTEAYYLLIGSGLSHSIDDKRDLRSVRCVKDYLPPAGGSASETVVIGTQTWMSKNLAVDVPGSVCYGNAPAKCAIYGRIYDWATAMALPPDCNSSVCASQISAKHRGICPAGWHIPSDTDWNTLMKFVNPACSDKPTMLGNILSSSCAGAGTKLKAAGGWYYDGVVEYGTDDYGFAALPGGGGRKPDGAGRDGYWWSSSEFNAILANKRSISYNREYVLWDSPGKNYLFSVRCIKD